MSTHYEDDRLRLLHGDALEQVATLESGSVQTVVTSPPYFGLRDYGEDGQYGAEATVADFAERLVALFREVRRVLADDGTVWLNLGDSYDRKTKNLLGVPWRVAFALQDDGWVFRSDIVWNKPNPMPESISDRPTKAHEYLFLLAKNPRYYYDADAIREDYLTADRPGERKSYSPGSASNYRKDGGHEVGRSAGLPLNEAGRNKRTVWTAPTSHLAAAHFAVYPPELIRPCIRAGSRVGGTVLDPFSGSGTTGMVALQEGRKYVGIDLNADYLNLSLRERFQEQTLDIFGDVA